MMATPRLFIVLAFLGCFGPLATFASPIQNDFHRQLVAKVSEAAKHHGYGDAVVDLIVDILENLRVKMKTGIPELGVPVLDPLPVGNFDLNLQLDEFANVVGFFDNMSVASLSQFEIKDLKVNIFSLSVEMALTFSNLKLDGIYNINGSALYNIIPVFGGGHFSVTAKDVTASIAVQAGKGAEGIEIETLDAEIQVQSLSIILDNILGGGLLETLVDLVLGNTATKLVNEVSERMLSDLTAWLQIQLNKMLKGLAIPI